MKKNAINLFCILFIALLFSSCFRSTTDATATDSNGSTGNRKFTKNNFNLESVDDLYTFFTYSEGSYPLVSAHRGGPQEHLPENAIETFEFHAKNNPLIIECDIRMSKDSVLVLMHDESLERTTTGSGKVSDYTLTELKELDLVTNDGKITNYKIPTLEETLTWGRNKVIFTLDVKQNVPYNLVSNIVNKTKAEAYSIIITYNAAQAKAMHRVNPELMISVSVKSRSEWNKLITNDIPDNRLVGFVGTREPDQELLDLLHNHGIKSILGTLGNLDKQADARGYQVYAEYIEKGIDIISTDRPVEAQKALDFYIKKHNITSPFVNN